VHHTTGHSTHGDLLRDGPDWDTMASSTSTTIVGEQRRARGPIERGLWFAIGWLAVVVGGIGVIVPGLPTTGFMVLAAACFARSSPRFEQWVLDLPGVGKSVADYRAGLGMPKRAKVIAISMMSVAIAISAGLLVEPTWLRLTIVAAGVVGVWYIVRRVPTAVAVAPST
jgi:uncharacterized membrane protein YbaN (DUF454 family)